MDDFWLDLNDGEVHARDRLQFELKSEFLIHRELKENYYRQDFYLFIPNSLQVSEENYSSKKFYEDETTIIRYRTPKLTIKEIADDKNAYSPLNRISEYLDVQWENFPLPSCVDELKLFGAIYRASLRESVHEIVKKLSKRLSLQESEELSHLMFELTSQTEHVMKKLRKLKEKANNIHHFPVLKRNFRYLDELTSLTTEGYLLALLKEIRESGKDQFPESDKLICHTVLKEQLYRKTNNLGPSESCAPPFKDEAILYRRGLLNRYVLESLQLKNLRFSLEEKHKDILGVIAAGLSMFIYMGLFAWKSPSYILNSFPFVAFAVVLYILKDRIKEGLKSLYHSHAKKWFPDYSTEIKAPKGNKIGRLQESFSFVNESQLPKELKRLRNSRFHDEFPKLKRQETVIHYKQEAILKQTKDTGKARRRQELTMIFRFNVRHLLEKARDPLQTNLEFDPYSQQISEKLFPKVYHLNIIISSTSLESNGSFKHEMKLFRVVVDKSGIRRVELLSNTS